MSMDDVSFVRTMDQPAVSPPASTIGIVSWLRANLFSSVGNTITTVIGIALIALIVPPIVRWAFIDAVWTGQDRTACAVPDAGACWAWRPPEGTGCSSGCSARSSYSSPGSPFFPRRCGGRWRWR